jgi:hypothetical protein
MERLAIDTMGPLTKDKDGYQYIVVIIDCFSRWVELYAAKDATGMEAAQALYYHMGRYGSCTQLITDNGSQYTSELMNDDLAACKYIALLPIRTKKTQLWNEQIKKS